MKKVFTILACVWSMSSYGQYADLNYFIGFDKNDTATFAGGGGLSVKDSTYLLVDTFNYKHNVWQVGKPAKLHFTSAYTVPNAIITDTVHPCSADDTSIFIFTIPKNAWAGMAHFSFLYKLDIDTGDLARIEVSEDTGKHWINILTDTTNPTYPDFVNSMPNLSQSTLIWDSVSYLPHNLFPDLFNYGLLKYRFTFITGASTKARDGWMLDNFRFDYWGEGIPNINNNILTTISPNPATDNIDIKYTLQSAADLTLSLTNTIGQVVKTKLIRHASSGSVSLPVSDLPNGLYFYTLKADGGSASGKLVIRH